MKRYLSIYKLLLLAVFGLQSCFFSEEDTFDDSSANRATTDVIKCQDILKNAPNGWKLEYYVGRDYSMGAITFLMKFDGQNVQVACKAGAGNYKPGDKVTSLYQVKSEQSTMLTFNSFNSLLHSFSAPLGMNVNMEGDYEFIIMSASPEKIILQGKKYKNIMEMTRMPEDEPWLTYIKNLLKIEESAFLSTYYLQQNEQTLKRFYRNPGTLSTFDIYNINASDEEDAESISYIYTKEGIKLQSPYVINGISIQNFKWDTFNRKFICIDDGGNGISLKEFYPDGYLQYDDFIGEYILGFGSNMTGEGYTEATITPLVEGESYILSGLPLTYYRVPIDAILKYDKATGQIILDSQDLGLNQMFYYYFAIAAGITGYAHPELTLVPRLRNGLISVVASKDPLGFYLSDKTTQTNNTLIVWAFSSENYSESNMLGYIEYFEYLMLRKKTDADL